MLGDRRNIKMAVECHKHVYQSDSSLSCFFKQKTSGRFTRHSNNMIIDKTKTDFGCRAFSIRGPDFWNKLLENLPE